VVSPFVTISNAFRSYQLNGQIESRDIAWDSSAFIFLVPTDFERPFVDALDFTSPNTALSKGRPNYGTANQAEPGSPRRISPHFLTSGERRSCALFRTSIPSHLHPWHGLSEFMSKTSDLFLESNRFMPSGFF
jgi:hypothetical protein